MNYTLVWCVYEKTRAMRIKSFDSYDDLVKFVYKDIDEDPVNLVSVDKQKTLFYLNI